MTDRDAAVREVLESGRALLTEPDPKIPPKLANRRRVSASEYTKMLDRFLARSKQRLRMKQWIETAIALLDSSAPESVEPPDAWATAQEVVAYMAGEQSYVHCGLEKEAWDSVPVYFRHPPTDSREPTGWIDLETDIVYYFPEVTPDADLVPVFFHRPPTDSTPVGEGEKLVDDLIVVAHDIGRHGAQGRHDKEAACQIAAKNLRAALLAALRTSKEAPATREPLCWIIRCDNCGEIHNWSDTHQEPMSARCVECEGADGDSDVTFEWVPVVALTEAPAAAPAESEEEAPMREHAEAIYRECIAVMRCQCGAETLAMSGGVVCKASREMVTECVAAAPAGEVVATVEYAEEPQDASTTRATLLTESPQPWIKQGARLLIRAEDPPSEEQPDSIRCSICEVEYTTRTSGICLGCSQQLHAPNPTQEPEPAAQEGHGSKPSQLDRNGGAQPLSGSKKETTGPARGSDLYLKGPLWDPKGRPQGAEGGET